MQLALQKCYGKSINKRLKAIEQLQGLINVNAFTKTNMLSKNKNNIVDITKIQPKKKKKIELSC